MDTLVGMTRSMVRSWELVRSSRNKWPKVPLHVESRHCQRGWERLELFVQLQRFLLSPGFKYFVSPLLGEDFHFDYFSDGLKALTSLVMHYTFLILWLRLFADFIVNNLGGAALVVKLALFRSILGGRWKMVVWTSHGIRICFLIIQGLMVHVTSLKGQLGVP